MAIFLGILPLFVIFPVFGGLIGMPGMLIDGKRYLLYCGMFAVAIAVLFSYVVPTPDMDLSRYWAFMDELSTSTIGDSLDIIVSGEDPLAYLSMFGVSSLLGVRWIASFAALFGYAIYFYLIWYQSRASELAGYARFGVTVFFILTHHAINSFTGYRFGLAVAVFVLGCHLFLIRRRFVSGTALVVVSSLFHSSLVTVVGLLLLLLLLRKFTFELQAVVIILAAGSVSVLLLLSDAISSLDIFAFVGDRADVYLSGHAPSGWWVVHQVVSGALVALCALLLLRARPDGLQVVFLRLSFLVPVLGLVSVENFHIASRLFTISRLLFVILLIQCLSARLMSSRTKIVFLSTGVFIGLGTAFNQFVALSGVGFFEIVVVRLFQASVGLFRVG